MEISLFKNNEQFIKAFDIDSLIDYKDIVPLKDCIGFSIKRVYPPTIRYKPPLKQDGTPDTISCTWVIYDFPADNMKFERDLNRIPIRIKISPISRFLENRFSYDFQDKNSPTKESLMASKKTPAPISLEFNENFFYDHEKGSIINDKNERLSAQETLDAVFKKHCDTIHPIKGFKLNSKFKFQRFLIKSNSVGLKFLKWILKLFFGRELKSKEFLVGHAYKFSKSDMKLAQTDKIKIFGYEASKNIIITFSIIVLSTYSIAYFFIKENNKFISGIVSSPLLVLCSAIIILWILDHIIPAFLFWAINFLISKRNKLYFIEFRF